MASIQEELRDNTINRNLSFIPMTNAGCDFLDKAFNQKNNFCNICLV